MTDIEIQHREENIFLEVVRTRATARGESECALYAGAMSAGPANTEWRSVEVSQ